MDYLLGDETNMVLVGTIEQNDKNYSYFNFQVNTIVCYNLDNKQIYQQSKVNYVNIDYEQPIDDNYYGKTIILFVRDCFSINPDYDSDKSNGNDYAYQIKYSYIDNNRFLCENDFYQQDIIRYLLENIDSISNPSAVEVGFKQALLEKACELDPVLQYQIAYDKRLRGKYEQFFKYYENYNPISDPQNDYHDDIKALLNIASNPLIANKISESTREYEERYGNKKDDNKYIDAANYFKDNFKPQKISDIIDEIQQKRQNYSCDFIKNVLICIAQNFITVFAGQPGTGKTSLCDIIAGALGLDKLRYDALDISRYISVSVERGWNSKSELIGYYNALSKEYEDSGNGLYHALKLLNKEAAKKEAEEKASDAYPFFVLLDEANLSPVEHYWSAFMKLADESELHKGYRGEITIGGGEKLTVPDQLRFLATVNNDLTTEPLSPRLLDRTSVIKLPEVDFNSSVSELQITGSSVYWSGFKKAFLPKKENKLPDLSLEVGDEDITLEEFLKRVYSIFKEAKMPVSIRIQNRIAQYIASAVALDMPVNIAMDYAIAQNLLPKINGYYEDYADFISKLSGVVEYTAYAAQENKTSEDKKYPLLYDTLYAFEKAKTNNEYISYLSL